MSIIKTFYTDRLFLLRYFFLNTLASAIICEALYAFHSPGFYEFHFSWWNLALIPLGVYIGGLSVVFIHNASHGSFPLSWLNSISGHTAGLHQLWGFINWKLTHFIHHQYADDLENDPHPPRNLTFWQYGITMAIYSINKIISRYFDHWGKTFYTKTIINAAIVVYAIMVLVNLMLWYLLLGPAGFFFFYLPSYFFNQFFFMHINYFGHPKNSETRLSAPRNLDHNWYYKIANAIWFGIYYHDNHHRRPILFNPRKFARFCRHSIT